MDSLQRFLGCPPSIADKAFVFYLGGGGVEKGHGHEGKIKTAM